MNKCEECGKENCKVIREKTINGYKLVCGRCAFKIIDYYYKRKENKNET